MVSFNTILTLGGIGAAILIFKQLGGGAGIGTAIGSQIGGFTEALGSQVTQAFNKFGNLVETPQLVSNVPEGFRLDPTETRDYDEYLNYQKQSYPQSETSYGESGNESFIFPKTTTSPGIQTPNEMTLPTAISYGQPLPPFAGSLEYVVNTNFPNARKATEEEKSFLQSYGIGL